MTSPKDYLTDRIEALRELLEKQGIDMQTEDGYQVFCEQRTFLTKTIQQSMEVGEKKMGGSVLKILEGGKNIPLDIKAPLLIKKAVMFIAQRLLVIGTKND